YPQSLRPHGRRWRVARLRHRLPERPRRVLGVPPRHRSAALPHRERPAARAQAGHVQRDLRDRPDPAPRPRARPRAPGDRPQAGGGLTAYSALILRRRVSAVSKDGPRATIGASWFETRVALLTTRVESGYRLSSSFGTVAAPAPSARCIITVSSQRP